MVKQTYLSPSDGERVFNDGALLSYSPTRRAWILTKDGEDLVLRDTNLPSPDEVFSYMKDEDQELHQKKLDMILAKIFPLKGEAFYLAMKMFLAETMIGIVETPHGGMPAYDVEHARAILEDLDNSNVVTEGLLRMIVAECYASRSGFFLHVPPSTGRGRPFEWSSS